MEEKDTHTTSHVYAPVDSPPQDRRKYLNVVRMLIIFVCGVMLACVTSYGLYKIGF